MSGRAFIATWLLVAAVLGFFVGGLVATFLILPILF